MTSFKKILFFLITLTLGVVFFLIVSGRVEWSDVAESLSLVRPWQFAFLFGLTLTIHTAATMAWWETLRYMGFRLPRRRLWRILVVGFSVSFLTPVAFIGGEALVLYLLKKEAKVPWHRGINSLIVLKLADFVLHSIFIFSGLIAFMFLTGFAGIEVISSLTLIPLALIIFLAYFFTQVSRRRSVVKPALKLFGLSEAVNNRDNFDLDKEEMEITGFFNLKNRKAWAVLGATFFKYLASWAQAFFLLFFLTGQASALNAWAIHAFAGLSVLFLLPATLGSLEVLQMIAFSGLGLSGGAAVGFSLVWRGMRLLICALSIFYALVFVGRMLEGKIALCLKKIKSGDKPRKGNS